MASGVNGNQDNRLTAYNQEYSALVAGSNYREQRDRAKGWVPNFYYRTMFGQVSFQMGGLDDSAMSSSERGNYKVARANGFAIAQNKSHIYGSSYDSYNPEFNENNCTVPERLGGEERNYCQKMRIFERMNKNCVWFKGKH